MPPTSNRGQAAMEFLMTYGWAIFVVLAAIGALAYFGVLSPDKFLSDKCTAEPPFACVEYKVQPTATENIYFLLQNSGGTDMQQVTVDLTCDDGQPATAVTTFPAPLENGGSLNATFTSATAPVAQQRWKGNFTMTYMVSGKEVDHTSEGNIVVRAES